MKHFKEDKLINYHMRYINELNKLKSINFILEIYMPYIINKNINIQHFFKNNYFINRNLYE